MRSSLTLLCPFPWSQEGSGELPYSSVRATGKAHWEDRLEKSGISSVGADLTFQLGRPITLLRNQLSRRRRSHTKETGERIAPLMRQCIFSPQHPRLCATTTELPWDSRGSAHPSLIKRRNFFFFFSSSFGFSPEAKYAFSGSLVFLGFLWSSLTLLPCTHLSCHEAGLHD